MILVWHDRDLRIEDHAALFHASKLNEPLCGIYIDRGDEGLAMRWWLEGALKDLRESYRKKGSELLVLKGNPIDIFTKLGATKIFAHADFKKTMRGVTYIDENRLVAYGILTNSEGNPLRVFTPFWKRFQQSISPRAPRPAPEKLLMPVLPKELQNTNINFSSHAPWEKKLSKHFKPTRESALLALKAFKKHAGLYTERRNTPSTCGTSQLSPYLAAGLISPHEVFETFKNEEPFIRQLVWREFAHYLLDHFPQMTEEPFSPKFKGFPWDENPDFLERWQKGKTGYPIVDAAMRQLWETGWMHNRLRMIVGSFLVKDLNISWQEGARWFWDTLIDADLANNTFGWQWVGGMGPDAAPYFRIFNPILQSKKFDPEGIFIKQYIPELSNLDPKAIHAPWEEEPLILASAGVKLGDNYPYPMVDHKVAAGAAKERFSSMQG